MKQVTRESTDPKEEVDKQYAHTKKKKSFLVYIVIGVFLVIAAFVFFLQTSISSVTKKDLKAKSDYQVQETPIAPTQSPLDQLKPLKQTKTLLEHSPLRGYLCYLLPKFYELEGEYAIPYTLGKKGFSLLSKINQKNLNAFRIKKSFFGYEIDKKASMVEVDPTVWYPLLEISTCTLLKEVK